MSEQTMQYHYDKHHAGYVKKLNDAIEGTDLAGKSLEDIVKVTSGDAAQQGTFNNAAQVWNHTFFWNSMSPDGGGAPSGRIGAQIDADFGSYDKFAQAFKGAAAGQFGSGWAWLVLDGGTLSITKTSNADTPLVHGQKALLTIDVWEHAYYLDHQNDRPGYIDGYLEKLVNWSFAEENL